MNKGLTRLLEQALKRDPASVNTDWDGTLLITALLKWGSQAGMKACEQFALQWFDYHRAHDAHLSDEEYYARYIGVRATIIREGPLPFTAYCSHWGIAYTLPGISLLGEKRDAAEVSDAIASFILHRAARSPQGCVYHDEDTQFLIPDTCYFAAPVMAIASDMTGNQEYLEQAIYQLEAYIDLMQNRRTGLAYTMWSKEGMPENYWCRASGWLGGALVNTLPYVPKDHPKYGKLADSVRRLADGICRVQRNDGGFHVLLDRPDLPVDCTGPAMLGMALRQAVRLGILDSSYDEPARRAWHAAERHVDDNGTITGAYTGWALTAMSFGFPEEDFDAERDFVKGLLLLAGAWFHDAD